ncbi:MAG: AraC family transcriptional regulator, partial [Kiritimatiellia bacterium]
MIENSSHEILGELLKSRLDITQIRHEHFPKGFQTKSQVVPCCRFIMILGGTVDYTVEQHSSRLSAGQTVFVPPWIWRTWQVHRKLELLWVVFRTDPGIFSGMDDDLELKVSTFAVLREKMEHLLALWQAPSPSPLLLEGELKALLARFFTDPLVNRRFQEMREQPTETLHSEVRLARDYLRSHFIEPTALGDMQDRVQLHPDYFGDLFHKQLHQTPNQYLTQLRMRTARHYLKETQLFIKQIADRVGYADPHYFTRAYHKFWGHPPGHERKQESADRISSTRGF